MQNVILITETDLRTLLSETVKKEMEFFRPEEQPKDNTLLTRQETAKILGISLPTLNNYSKEGKIPSYRIGSRIRYKKQEVISSLSSIQNSKFR